MPFGRGERRATGTWDEFLADADKHGHAVQIYREVSELAESVAAYVAAGLDAGAPALLVATPGHRRVFLERLARHGWDVDQLELDGMLVCQDAEKTLAAITRHGQPSAAALDEIVGSLIDELAEQFPGAEPRVFGEMVDLLVREGADDAAISLEELWNGLARGRRFSLLCGYELDVFDRETQAGRLPAICSAHSHVRPAYDTRRLAAAVDGALEDVLGSAEAGMVYVVVAEQLRGERVPLPELVLMWVSRHMPANAKRILAAARERYAAAV
jgi:KaiC/GvpD/RAD55 family RecA-like ATPase